jgi:integrase
MAIGNITKTAVDRLAGGWLWDAGHREAVKGFGARRQTDGVFYYLRYRAAGRQRMQSIGRHGSPWTPDTARTEAKRLLGIVAGGKDPGRATHGEGFGAVAERYLALREAGMKPRAFAEIARHLRQHAKPLHRLTLSEINRAAVAERLRKIEADSGKVTRNRVRSSLSAFFTWAIAEGLLGDDGLNPVTGTASADEGASRTRVLSDAELAAIWRALGNDRYGDIVRLLILTGQRREEIGGLRWIEIVPGPGPDRGAIILPPERTKNSQQHELPLSPVALAILNRQRERGHFVFGGSGGFSGWSNHKAALDAKLTLGAGFRLHDLRRTVATRMGDLGVLPHVVEAILNHISGFRSGVAGVYNLTRYEPEMREALARWADHVVRITARPTALTLVRR